MGILRIALAYLAAAAATYVASSIFYTQQILAKQAEIGAVYTASQQAATYFANLTGLGLLGAMFAIGLAIAFVIAAILKRVLKPLAPIAYPLAGAAAVWTVIYLIETVMAPGGVGAIGGARGVSGMALQALAGAIGGFVFAALLPRKA